MSHKPLATRGHRLYRFSALLAVLSLLAACGGTQVYDTTRTVVYNDAMYNVTDTKTFSSVVEGTLADGSKVDLSGADRKRVEALLKENGPMNVRMSFEFDEQEMLYRSGKVERWSDFNKMSGDMDDARKDINRLMKEKKTAQIKIR